MTIQELLAQWDRGESIWTMEMGGIGPSYEQAIQLLMIELVRDHAGHPLPSESTFWIWGEHTMHRINHACGGFSGAQVGAAKQIAFRLLRDGYDAFLASIPQDRKILVSAHFPHLEPIPVPVTQEGRP